VANLCLSKERYADPRPVIQDGGGGAERIRAAHPAAAHPATLEPLAWLHDVAKDWRPAEQERLVADLDLQLNDPCEKLPVYLHGVVGAAYLAQRLGYADAAVLEAIAAHSYNRPLGPASWRLGWCLRAADVLAPVQEWRGMRRLRSLAYAGELATAAILLSRWVCELYGQWGLPVHPLLAALEQELCAPLAERPDFFTRW